MRVGGIWSMTIVDSVRKNLVDEVRTLEPDGELVEQDN